jgi:hypothetical protein
MGKPTTIAELSSLLASLGAPPDAYCLTGGLPNEAYTIERFGNGWRTYYSERGNRTGVREFTEEAVACAELLSRVAREFHLS